MLVVIKVAKFLDAILLLERFGMYEWCTSYAFFPCKQSLSSLKGFPQHKV